MGGGVSRRRGRRKVVTMVLEREVDCDSVRRAVKEGECIHPLDPNEVVLDDDPFEYVVSERGRVYYCIPTVQPTGVEDICFDITTQVKSCIE